MYSTISFPGLGLEMNPPRSFSIGSFSIYIYGILIALGMILAVVYALRRKAQFGLTEDDLIDGVLCIVPFAIICARLYYCIFSWEQYADNPISILYIWEGGLAIYGGVLGALAGILVYAKVKKINPLTLFDIVSLGFLIGQALGRWGNFFNREAFGAETENFLRMGLYNALNDTTTFHHPTFLYESLWNFAGFLALHFLSKKRQYDGQIALGYVAWYGHRGSAHRQPVLGRFPGQPGAGCCELPAGSCGSGLAVFPLPRQGESLRQPGRRKSGGKGRGRSTRGPDG